LNSYENKKINALFFQQCLLRQHVYYRILNAYHMNVLQERIMCMCICMDVYCYLLYIFVSLFCIAQSVISFLFSMFSVMSIL